MKLSNCLARNLASLCLLSVGSIVIMTMVAFEDISKSIELSAYTSNVRGTFFGPPLHPDPQMYSTGTRRAIQATTPVAIQEMKFEEDAEHMCVARPQHIQEIVNERALRNRKPLIYLHKAPSTHLPLKDMYFPNGQKYPCFNCKYTTDEERQPEADVVVVLYRKILEYQVDHITRVPTKYCGQLFVMLQVEPPGNIDPLTKNVPTTAEAKYREARIFDVSSTFRLDSDLPRPYLLDLRIWLENAKKNYVPIEQRDSEFPAGWIASNCKTSNDRIGYVEELMKHIGVKSYGKCLKNADIEVPREAKNWNEGAEAQIGKHKFYLAFENANCDYYTTEKFYYGLKTGVIPVVMGAPQAKLYVPNNHSALFVSDFESPEALAKRMHEINNDDALFEYYTSHLRDPTQIDAEFSNRWMRKRPPHVCQLCDLVRNSMRDNLRGVKYDDWVSCEEKHGTWRTGFKPLPAVETTTNAE